MWKALRKRRALRSYRRQLPVHLRRTYGTQQHYPPEDVHYVIRRWGMSEVYACYALAMYCDRAMFDAFHASKGEACDYDRMRAEAGDTLPVTSETTEEHADSPAQNVFVATCVADVSGGGWFSSWSAGGSADTGGCDGGDAGGFDSGGCDGGGGGGGD